MGLQILKQQAVFDRLAEDLQRILICCKNIYENVILFVCFAAKHADAAAGNGRVCECRQTVVNYAECRRTDFTSRLTAAKQRGTKKHHALGLLN